MIFTSATDHPLELEQIKILKSLQEKYDMPTFTEKVIVEKGSIPHSHPVLTLNTRTQDELVILKTLVHEQFHWYAHEHPRELECINYLKTKYKDDGEHNKSGKYPDSYWGHIIVCFNTRNYLSKILQKDQIKYVYEQWQSYPTLEKEIADNFEEYKKELDRFEITYSEKV